MILALSRPDERKNFVTLVEAYGESEALQAGRQSGDRGRESRRHPRDGGRRSAGAARHSAEPSTRTISTARWRTRSTSPRRTLPSSIAWPPSSGGLFINPALTEPFGLTLIEAAASGLPIVATEDGGPRDIIANCSNGLLIDPLDKPRRWPPRCSRCLQTRALGSRCPQNGLEGVRAHYRWPAHAERYLRSCEPILASGRAQAEARRSGGDRCSTTIAPLFTDLDQNLLGDRERRWRSSAVRAAREPQTRDIRHRHRPAARLGAQGHARIRDPAAGRADHARWEPRSTTRPG